MSYYNVPERPLDPPEDRIAFECEICGGDIYEGEEYYDIPDLGKCCANCINDAHRYDAEAPQEDYDEKFYNEEV